MRTGKNVDMFLPAISRTGAKNDYLFHFLVPHRDGSLLEQQKCEAEGLCRDRRGCRGLLQNQGFWKGWQMSRLTDQGRDPETLTHTFVRQGGDIIEMVMPPMDGEAKLAKLRSTRFLLEMLIKHRADLKTEKGQEAATSI